MGIARSITDGRPRALALAEVAAALARVQLYQKAETASRSITDPDVQVLALAAVAKVLAGAGLLKRAGMVALRAEAVARSITDPELQARTLAMASQALTLAGEKRSASQAASAACALGRFGISAGPVLMLLPSAFTTLDLTLEAQRQSSPAERHVTRRCVLGRAVDSDRVGRAPSPWSRRPTGPVLASVPPERCGSLAMAWMPTASPRARNRKQMFLM
jgi:hypothetical protein